ncbi:MAG: CheR family methyltransferase [Promethearchaeota archaeon]
MIISEPAIDKIRFDPESIQSLIAHLRDSTKIKFECYKTEFLERRIKARMYRLNLTSDKDYMDYLKRNPSEFNEFSDLFTINYTYFFRNCEVYQALMQDILNHKIRRQNMDVLKIWSAPCSTGEEPYSLAMMFDYLKKTCRGIPEIEIVASDIDINALKIAKKGSFGLYSVHDLPKIYNSYFTQHKTKYGPQYELSDEIKEKVTFIQEDLTEGHQFNQKYDIIFCRNFLIYLNRHSQRKVLKTLSQHLIANGLLVIGKTEMIINSKSNKFNLLNPKVHFYSKI